MINYDPHEEGNGTGGWITPPRRVRGNARRALAVPLGCVCTPLGAGGASHFSCRIFSNVQARGGRSDARGDGRGAGAGVAVFPSLGGGAPGARQRRRDRRARR